MPFLTLHQRRQAAAKKLEEQSSALAKSKGPAPSAAPQAAREEEYGPNSKKSLLELVQEEKARQGTLGVGGKGTRVEQEGEGHDAGEALGKKGAHCRATGWSPTTHLFEDRSTVQRLRHAADIFINSIGPLPASSLSSWALDLDDLRLPAPLDEYCAVHLQLHRTGLSPLQSNAAPSILSGFDTLVLGPQGSSKRSVSMAAILSTLLCDPTIVSPSQDREADGQRDGRKRDRKRFDSHCVERKGPLVLYVAHSRDLEMQQRDHWRQAAREIRYNTDSDVDLLVGNSVGRSAPTGGHQSYNDAESHVAVVSAATLQKVLQQELLSEDQAAAGGSDVDPTLSWSGNLRCVVLDEINRLGGDYFEILWRWFKMIKGRSGKLEPPQFVGIGGTLDSVQTQVQQLFGKGGAAIIAHIPQSLATAFKGRVHHVVELVTTQNALIHLQSVLTRTSPPAVVLVRSREEVQDVVKLLQHSVAGLRVCGSAIDYNNAVMDASSSGSDRGRGTRDNDRRRGEQRADPPHVLVSTENFLSSAQLRGAPIRHVINLDLPQRDVEHTVVSRLGIVQQTQIPTRSEGLSWRVGTEVDTAKFRDGIRVQDNSTFEDLERKHREETTTMMMMTSFVHPKFHERALAQLKEVLLQCGHPVPEFLQMAGLEETIAGQGRRKERE